MSVLADECPNCGAPSSFGPDRDDVVPDDVMRRRRRVLGIGVIFFIAVAVLGRNSWFSWIDFDDPDHINPAAHAETDAAMVATTATELFETYRDNSQAWKLRFSKRPLEVSGTVVRVVNDPGGSAPNVLLGTSDPAAPLWIDLDKRSYDASATLKPGDNVTVQCRYTQRNWDPSRPIMRHCNFEQAKALPATQAPAALPQPPSKD